LGRGWNWPLVFLLLAFLLLQVSVVSRVFQGLKPECALIFVACAGLYAGPRWGMGLGILGGAFEAIFEGRGAGAFILSRALSGLLGGLIGERAFKENLLVASFVGLVCTWASEAAFGVVSPTMTFGEWLKVTAVESAWAVVLGPIFYLLMWLVCGLP